uniref:L1 transposable element RRM domain-containing protein n=1 Tax=Salarias fasciatus TaxID=181472 RepID=A0A672INY5_SALFA
MFSFITFQDGGVGLPRLKLLSPFKAKFSAASVQKATDRRSRLQPIFVSLMPCKTRQKTRKVKQQEETMAEPVTAAVLEETLKRFFNEAEKKSEEKFERLQNRVQYKRSQIAVIETRVQTNEETLPKLGDALAQVEKKLVALEDMNRRDNLRIMNIKEGEEKGSMLAYLTNNLPKWFPGLARSPPELMRAHRLGPPRQSTSPRTIIVKCLRFTDRDRILNESRKTAVLVSGKELRFAADFSDVTAQRRKSCYPVLNRARSLGFQAFLLYPAVIKLARGSDIRQFEDPVEAVKYLESIDPASASASSS